MPAVTVNFNVSIDASGSVEVFGQAKPTITNPIVCSVKLPATDLYTSNSDALFQFWEPSSDLGGISGERFTSWSKEADLRADINDVINGSMDASGANPVKINGTVSSTYTSQTEYYTHGSFGRLALSTYAHYLFGHIAATAAISNDQAFIDNMNGNTDATASHALLAKRLVDTIKALTPSQVTDIVKQVIGQDATRAKDEDNNALAPDEKQSLQFFANDIIYLGITLKEPGVTVSNNETAQLGEPSASAFGSDIAYSLQITLE